METYNLKATSRELVGKKVKQLRQQKMLPVVLYGKGTKNKNLVVDSKEFERIFKQTGSSALVSLAVDDDKKFKILIVDIQRDPVRGQLIHADLQKINMKEKIRTAIPLELIGTAPAVLDLEGNLITNKDEIEVECLPDALVAHIEVDISALKTFDDNIKISDLKVPEGIEVLDDPEEILLLVTPPRSEEELEAELAAEEKTEEEAVAELEAEATSGEEGETTEEAPAENKE